MTKEELRREAEAFDPEASTHGILLELVRLEESPEFLAQARKALEAFFARAERHETR